MTENLILPVFKEGGDKSSPLINKIRNNTKHIKKWAKRTETNCFRIFDREVRPYPIAIDYYAGRFAVHYFSPASDEDGEPTKELFHEIEDALSQIFEDTDGKIYWRTRQRNKETRQYEKNDDKKEYFTALEFGVKFWINLTDYLDTGLFLDHRETRHWVAKHSKDKRLLNLFAYTGSFSVHAAAQGAAFTKSVDMSNTYCAWAQDNFKLNELDLNKNEIVRADCLKFLEDEQLTSTKYDLIVIDPPTISRSKKMDRFFDIQFEYIDLIEHAEKLLNAGGSIYFSTNSRRFQFDAEKFPSLAVREISDKTRPFDFHDPKIHRCWVLKKS